MKTKSRWPKTLYSWTDKDILYISVPFTWFAPSIRRLATQRAFDWRKIVIGGPGAYLIRHYYPDYFEGLPVYYGYSMPGIMQKINPLATRTTTGCIRSCRFCAVGQHIIEPGGFRELSECPDLPIITDNNLLAASIQHFDKVIDRLILHEWADFEQGLDPRLLTPYHAARFAQIKNPMIRLALDNFNTAKIWESALEMLIEARVAKSKIRSYALIGFNTGPDEAWERCRWIEKHRILVLPMWYHRLDALKKNQVTEDQQKLGWNDYERRRIMQFYYQHKEAVAGAK